MEPDLPSEEDSSFFLLIPLQYFYNLYNPTLTRIINKNSRNKFYTDIYNKLGKSKKVGILVIKT